MGQPSVCWCRGRRAFEGREQGHGFGGGEAQVGGAQVGELALGAQAGEGQGRVGATDEHQAAGAGQVPQQVGDQLMNRLAGQPVVVVEHQGQPVGQGVEFDQEGLQKGVEGHGAWSVQQVEGGGQRAGGDVLNRPCQVGQEAQRVLVVLIERQPGHRVPWPVGAERTAIATTGRAQEPLGRQGRLSETCRGDDQGQTLIRGKAQPFH
jgi:hypothetical protein